MGLSYANCPQQQQQQHEQNHLTELEPYLANLNLSEALQDFGRLADLVLSHSIDDTADSMSSLGADNIFGLPSPCDSLEPCALIATTPSECCYSGGGELPASSDLKSSQEGTSEHIWYPSISITPNRWLSSPSFPRSPNYQSVSSGGGSPKDNSFVSSTVSSVQGDDEMQNKTRQSSTRKRHITTTKITGPPQRKRLKCRKCGLEQELEFECKRHSQLRASLEAKLLLYREFAHLLAANTRDPREDSELAQFGSRSLENVLECVLPVGLLGDLERIELERILTHFKSLTSAPV